MNSQAPSLQEEIHEIENSVAQLESMYSEQDNILGMIITGITYRSIL